MNKKMNTVLFTIGATIFNLISMLIINMDKYFEPFFKKKKNQ
jgi:amino acid permease